MILTRDAIRKMIFEAMDPDTDEDDAAELLDIASDIESSEGGVLRQTDRLSGEELKNMTPIEYVQMRNAESREEMEATPDLYIGMLADDPEHWSDYSTAYDLVRALLLSSISDIVKSERGTRPDLSEYQGMSVEELRDAHDDALESLSAYEEEEGWQSDIEDERRESERVSLDIATAEEEERHKERETMLTPEPGEQFPKSTGIGGRWSESLGDRWMKLAGITEK